MKKIRKLLLIILPFIIGGVGGYLIVFIGGVNATAEETLGIGGLAGIFLQLILILAALLGGYYLHIILHEAGHWLGGKLSGYTFVFFRVGSLTWVKEKGKIKRRKYQIAGTGGQCIMSPPPVRGTRWHYPHVVYGLGGGLANMLAGAFFLVLGLVSGGWVSMVLIALAIIGATFGLSNLLPLNVGGIATDGTNIRLCCKSERARRAMWIQLRYVAMMTQGALVRDIPPEWVQDIGELTDPVVGFLACLRYDYLMETEGGETARAYAREVLENPGKLFKLHKSQLKGELLFHELINECRDDEIERMYNEELQTHMKMLHTHLSTLRLQYAYDALYLKDEEKARASLAAFEKALGSTLIQGEIPSEQGLIEKINVKMKEAMP